MGAWAKHILTYLSKKYTIKQRQWLYEAFEEELGEQAAAHYREMEAAGEQVWAAKKAVRDLQTLTWQVAKWMSREGHDSSVCLGTVNQMNSMGDFDQEFRITTVRHTNEFKFVHDLLEQGELGNATSTRGVHPAKKWGIKDFPIRTEEAGFWDA